MAVTDLPRLVVGECAAVARGTFVEFLILAGDAAYVISDHFLGEGPTPPPAPSVTVPALRLVPNPARSASVREAMRRHPAGKGL